MRTEAGRRETLDLVEPEDRGKGSDPQALRDQTLHRPGDPRATVGPTASVIQSSEVGPASAFKAKYNKTVKLLQSLLGIPRLSGS